MCNDVFKTNFACIRKWSYPSVNDTENYDRNTEPGIPLKYGDIRSRRPYLAVYGRKRAWAFDLGRNERTDISSLLRLTLPLFNVGGHSRDGSAICVDEAISSSSDDSDEVHEALSKRRLHPHTNVTILDVCKDLSKFLRQANVNKSHSSSLLKLIKSLLPPTEKISRKNRSQPRYTNRGAVTVF